MTSHGDEPDATPAVLAAVEQGLGAPCSVCGRSICGHDVVLSYVLGFKGSTRCLGCLAFGLGRAVAELRENLLEHIHHRDCWKAGWRRANELEHLEPGARAACARLAAAADERRDERTQLASEGEASTPGADAEWNAGDMGCGDLVLELRLRLRALQPGQVLKVEARDPGAPADLPAWCGLTGHSLLKARHPTYLIRRKRD